MKSFLKIPIENRDTFAKILFGYFFILLLYRYNSSTFLIFQYGQPMKGPGVDWAFWFSLCSGFPHFIIQHYWACVLVDLAVVLFSIACFFSAKYRSIFCIGLTIFFFTQRITLETYSCSHSKSDSALFIALLPFCFKKEQTFNVVSEFSRYFLLYILTASAFYKFHNGALLDPTNFAITLVNQHSDLATLNPQHISYKMASFLMTKPILAAFSYIVLFLVQAVFIVGFLTRKFDKFLFVLLFLFALMTYLIMRIYNFDIMVLGCYLLFIGNNPADKVFQKK
jgi:hypothetical protein